MPKGRRPERQSWLDDRAAAAYKGTSMLSYLLDWFGLLVRWLHVVAGIAWIGASFYFVWLDNHLEPVAGKAGYDPGVAGELWAVHGGGFYRSQKYRVAPGVLPPTLHWFYWEAYTTWLSGFALLCLLYFVRAEAYLIDPAVWPLTKTTAISIALAVLAGNWVVYDALCRLLDGPGRALGLGVAALAVLDAWGLCHLFSGRGAFLLFGAALGTLMVANVLVVIIPGQRELVRAKQEGREPDAGPGLRGKQRSVHNTYFTLPVVFVMISNHYALTYGARSNWLVLLAMSFAGACIRAWFVARHKPKPVTQPAYRRALPAVLGVLALAGMAWALAPVRPGAVARAPVPREDGLASGPGAADGRASAGGQGSADVQPIIAARCVPCHASHPTQAGFNAPPNGLVFETPLEVAAHLPEIEQQVSMRTMPLGNLTRMTEAERAAVLAWIAGHTGGSIS